MLPMTNPTVADILAPKPEANPRIYAYAIADAAHAGQLKVGQTTRDVRQRVAEQLQTAAITNFTIEVDEPAARVDGSLITDHTVRARLRQKGFANPLQEWMHCTPADVRAARRWGSPRRRWRSGCRSPRPRWPAGSWARCRSRTRRCCGWRWTAWQSVPGRRQCQTRHGPGGKGAGPVAQGKMGNTD